MSVRKLVRAIEAEIASNRLYKEEGRWHVDLCTCRHCEALRAWEELSWFQKLLAKLDF